MSSLNLHRSSAATRPSHWAHGHVGSGEQARRIAGADTIFITGMLVMPLQFVQFGPAQPGHIWVLVALAFMVAHRAFAPTTVEMTAFLIFVATLVILTMLQDFNRIKAAEQLFKFSVIYPSFYLVGRWLGCVYSRNCPPIGTWSLVLILIAEIIVQRLSVPGIYQELDFAEGALHGTFKERTWLATYFFMYSYFILERGKSGLSFFLLNGVVALLSGAKTTLVACAMVLFLEVRAPSVIKIIVSILCVTFYWYVFSAELSGDKIQVRLQEERGLAFQESIKLIFSNWLGYGTGFVEYYFSNLALMIRGLGEGSNSVFSVPLDLMIMAGGVGLGLWLVFFMGIGLETGTSLLPVAALSLLNPLHQSEPVYFFLGMLISRARAHQKIAVHVTEKDQDASGGSNRKKNRSV